MQPHILTNPNHRPVPKTQPLAAICEPVSISELLSDVRSRPWLAIVADLDPTSFISSQTDWELCQMSISLLPVLTCVNDQDENGFDAFGNVELMLSELANRGWRTFAGEVNGVLCVVLSNSKGVSQVGQKVDPETLLEGVQKYVRDTETKH